LDCGRSPEKGERARFVLLIRDRQAALTWRIW
jgi:hypothetical protein